jgi:hypothetical protein
MHVSAHKTPGLQRNAPYVILSVYILLQSTVFLSHHRQMASNIPGPSRSASPRQRTIRHHTQHDKPKEPLVVKPEIVFSEGKKLLDNFTLPPLPHDDFPIYYVYQDNAPEHKDDENTENLDTYTSLLKHSAIADLIQSGAGNLALQVV